MSNVSGTSANTDLHAILDISKLSGCAQEQEVNDLLQFLQLEYKKYRKFKVCYDIIEQIVKEPNSLEVALCNKIKSIILSETVSQDIVLDSSCSKDRSILFAASDINLTDLSYPERNCLKAALEAEITAKQKSVGGSSKVNKESTKDGTPLLQLLMEDQILLEYKKKLRDEQEIYIENLLKQLELFEEISKLRLKKLPQISDQKVKECYIQTKMNYLKSRLAQEKVRVDIFTEESTTLEAYKEVIKDIKEQQIECRKDIEHLRDLKEKYNQVACKQYNEILKSYLQYKSAIEKKKSLYECIKS